MLRIYTRTIIGDKEIENEVEVEEILSFETKIRLIRIVLGLEEE